MNTERVASIARFGTIQMLGAIAGAVASIALIRQLGLAEAGELTYFRSVAELIVGLAVLGLPQAIVYLVAAKRVSIRELWPAILTLSLGTVTVVALLAAATLPLVGQRFSTNALIFTAVAVVGLYVTALARAAILSRSLSLLYSAVVVSTNISLLIIVLLATTESAVSLWGIIASIWLVIGLSVLAFVLLQARMSEQPTEPWTGLVRRHAGTLLSFSTWIWVQQVIAHIHIVLALDIIRTSGIPEDVGRIAAAITIYNVVSGPVTLIAPALLRLWSDQDATENSYRELRAVLWASSLVMFIATAGFIALDETLLALAFGKEMSGQGLLCTIFLVCAWFGMLGKTYVPLFHSRGRAKELVWAYTLRTAPLITLAAVAYLPSSEVRFPIAVALVWLAGEAFCTAYLMFKARGFSAAVDS